jgi:molecular chaperone GrpE
MADDQENGETVEDGPEEFSADKEGDANADLAEAEALRLEVAALKERALRALADAENTRKRGEREREETRVYAITRFARDLLSVSDNLNRALLACPPEAREGANEALKSTIEGIEATERELQSVLSRHGVTPIDAEGVKFDPNLHQAIAEVPTNDQPPGTVVSVVQTGYAIGDRLLRAAMVTVAKPAQPAQGNGGSPAGS